MKYTEQYIPTGAWLLVEKDKLPDKMGSIFVPTKAVDNTIKFACTGVVVGKSFFEHFENEWDNYMFHQVQVGDRVGFGATVPLLSPAPPDYKWESDERKFVTLHVTDVIGVFVQNEKERTEYLKRFNG